MGFTAMSCGRYEVSRLSDTNQRVVVLDKYTGDLKYVHQHDGQVYILEVEDDEANFRKIKIQE